ncbi:MAG: CBS domain-containing protein [Candidatus Bathyarchaeota archaeon]
MNEALIREFYNPAQTIALIVQEDELFTDILAKFTEKPYIRGIFVTDRQGKYSGMIKRDDLLKWAKFKTEHLTGFEDYIRKFSKETKARDLIHEYSEGTTVKEDDDISRALGLMFSRDLTDLPVLDKKGKIIGDVTIPELLSKILEITHTKK